MKYDIEIRNKAEKDLRSIPKRDAERIAHAILALSNGLTGDIKKTNQLHAGIPIARGRLAGVV